MFFLPLEVAFYFLVHLGLLKIFQKGQKGKRKNGIQMVSSLRVFD